MMRDQQRRECRRDLVAHLHGVEPDVRVVFGIVAVFVPLAVVRSASE